MTKRLVRAHLNGKARNWRGVRQLSRSIKIACNLACKKVRKHGTGAPRPVPPLPPDW